MANADDLLALIDPWAALADGRRQLLAAIEMTQCEGAGLARLLEIVVAADEALREVALAYAEGARDFSSVRLPRDRRPAIDPGDALSRAGAARIALMEAVAPLSPVLDEMIETPWVGSDTWRMHLLALAMDEVAAAHRLLDAHAAGWP